MVIAGQPNAGKSSLLNALAGAELAIVTPMAGTTRDVVAQTIQIEGVPLHVVDTAGLREASDEVERIGIERAWDQIGGADAVLFLHDLTRARRAADYAGADGADRERGCSALARRGCRCSTSGTSSTRAPAPLPRSRRRRRAVGRPAQGIDGLRQRLLEMAGWQAAPEGVYIARERHVQALRAGRRAPAAGAAASGAKAPALELLAEELRLAQNALNAITGAFGADDLLGVIFSRFCIGK